MLFDTHAHLNDEQFSGDLEDVLKRAYDNGVTRILVASYDEASSLKAVSICKNRDNLYCSVGVHPHDASKYTQASRKLLFETAKRNKKVVAIGEIGLDYHYEDIDKEAQKKAFMDQLELAHDLDLPVIIHDRDAHGDTMQIITEAYESGILNNKPGVLHCYSGSTESAMKYIEYGFYISFAGPVTFKNAGRVKEVMKSLPLSRILIETDCPYLAPHPHRGKRNEPAMVRFVAQTLSELKDITYEKACSATFKNACDLFGI